MKSVRDIDVSGKKVLVRVDYNLPMDENLNIADDNRIRATLPLIQYLIDCNARIILMSHMGRPKGEIIPELSLAPAAVCLSELINQKVDFADDCIGKNVEEKVRAIEKGGILFGHYNHR